MGNEHPHADIHWRDDGQPLSRAFDDVYFSRESGLEETRYVFLEQNHLARRWTALATGERFTIGETGFGTGLNFLAAWHLWLQTAPADAHLHFISVEKYPLRRADLRRALALWPELEPLANQLLLAYPPLLAGGVHRLQFGQVALTLVIGEASEGFATLRLGDDTIDRQVDAWFLDGFAPAKNPAMWSEALFRNIAALSRSEATFATFTCAGLVKRGLREAGFALEKVRGFGRKREMLRGQLLQEKSSAVVTTPWHLPRRPSRLARRSQIAVIGAGIAGATTARALAERGYRVSVFEAGSAPGSGGSGNAQGILYAKLSHRPGPNGDFNLHALLFALRYYPTLCPEHFHACGLLQLAQGEKERELQAQLRQWLAARDAAELALPVDPAQASELAGTSLHHAGIFFPRAGWLEPASVCATLLRHPNIHLYCGTSVDHLSQQGPKWQLGTAAAQHEADAVVICCAHRTAGFTQSAELPLRPIRGQVSIARTTEHSARLRVALCGDGYIAPPFQSQQSFGATFKLKETGAEVREEEHRENLQTLAEVMPDAAQDFAGQSLSGRAAVRAASPDYLPMTGPLPDWDSLRGTYDFLRRNRKALIAERCHYPPGLYTLAGLGSRGFTYAPLAAEVLASWISGEPMPVTGELARALHPARFAIRDLGKNRQR
ncbi:bifunctional tRNA (5-methylaminomethyl-2-thiouridine)(34)-methyltransferase MnmD/FAD-dependent 5-carboxymethylaminomethyl-2-thiouridine(34) oxidoreductase MnmC [Microbulbifer guangxiensis]|uniref:bifunctional tRNA (5-methylaminomethyl-2-thiouridine)(34)-methyltransferase MnmD/FAD-dependent 5-carboxymethylaminomethyl-2-thiouridine(34) oxidoreductase MnmC n=1 Tax=Microbulbifer guangxiensis TaxID=2904249 RepID=UPI001F013338|nr:bifunctional tRNA (5-methylaminomethyl-2-thiouridine)(34)-methyltransferase MnmD/FAD-dependent 5-carboxymethylaminomethyl-2-thiouridine(34) oxidoreductase MnmC [Microbulbifer guangxiensis]